MLLSRPFLPLVLGLLVATACGGNDAAGTPDAGNHVTPDASTTIDAGPDPACTFAAPASAKLPHVDASDEKAKPMIEAIAAVLAAQDPPLPASDPLLLPTLGCGIVSSPGGSGGPSCQLTIAFGSSGAGLIVEGALAQQLFDALATAGAEQCEDLAHGEFIHLQDVEVNLDANEAHFDDASSYALPPAANVSVSGAPAEALLAAASDAAIDDCAADTKIFLVCTRLGAAPECSTVRRPLRDVAGSRLVYTCLPDPLDDPPSQIDAAHALGLWNALLAAAEAAGYEPDDGGPLSATTVINASFFHWDGHTLGFSLTTGSAQPPPPPSPHP